jgi:prevent-host-death family protein
MAASRRVTKVSEARSGWVTATRAKNEFAQVLDTALARGQVVITKHDAPKAVLVSIDKYNELAGNRVLEELTHEFEELLVSMQKPETRKRAQRAFDASPAELGKAAVAAARKR